MAPSHSRHLLVWTTLPIAILLSYLWFKRKRTETTSDPQELPEVITRKEEDQTISESVEKLETTSDKIIKRSLSGVESSPIDIVFPPELKSTKSSEVVISDEDLDLEIEKIKSMKSTTKSSVERYSSTKKDIEPDSTVDCIKKESPPKLMATAVTPKKQATNPIKDVKKEEKVENKNLKPSQPPAKKEGKVENKNLKPLPNKSRKGKMVEKDVSTNLKKKFNSLKMEADSTQNLTASTVATVMDQEIDKQNGERDSANHSPADVMLASPSLSCISDSHSEGSSDSGKGCSEVATPPSRTPAGDGSVSSDTALPTIYQFIIPQSLVGKLIGRHGAFVNQIKSKTHTHIVIDEHPENDQLKVCIMEGLQVEIENALKMIRNKFPLKRYPELSLEQILFEPSFPTISLAPEQLCLKLLEGINNDTIVSCMVTPNHLFLQQPTHPSFPNLNSLTNCMNACYADKNSPMLPNPLPDYPVCAAYSLGAWYRALVISSDEEADTSYIKFLDYGGYASVKNSDLRQIRADFLMLPFQASECFLVNVKPAGGEDAEWAEEAFSLVADLTKGSIILTQVAEYTEDGIPLVLVYVSTSSQQIVFLNGELVNRGYAEWVSLEENVTQGASVTA